MNGRQALAFVVCLGVFAEALAAQLPWNRALPKPAPAGGALEPASNRRRPGDPGCRPPAHRFASPGSSA